jgi:hypothetical protein
MFDIGDISVSPELAATQPCPYPSLASYARTQAQKIADAAGAKVGPVVAISDSPSDSGAVQTVALVKLVSYLSSSVLSDFGGRMLPLASFEISCSMTIQFKLLH